MQRAFWLPPVALWVVILGECVLSCRFLCHRSVIGGGGGVREAKGKRTKEYFSSIFLISTFLFYSFSSFSSASPLLPFLLKPSLLIPHVISYPSSLSSSSTSKIPSPSNTFPPFSSSSSFSPLKTPSPSNTSPPFSFSPTSFPPLPFLLKLSLFYHLPPLLLLLLLS